MNLQRYRLLCSAAAVASLCAASFAVPIPASASSPGDSGGMNELVHYDFSRAQEGTEGIPNSVSGSQFGMATITDGNRQVAGRYSDGALMMDGGYYVELPDGILKGQRSVTVSTVVKNGQQNSSGAWTYLWSLGGTGQEGKGSWAVSTHTSLYTSITSKANGDGETYFSASRNLSMSEYETLTATIDGDTKLVTLYINGQKVGSANATTTPDQFGANDHDVIGESRYPGLGDGLFQGAIRSFTVYGEALSPQQIARTLPSDGVADLLTSEVSSLAVPPSSKDDFALPQHTDNASISWSSSNPEVVSVDASGNASVAQQATDQNVVLTATLSPDPGLAIPDKSVTKTFAITVPKSLDEHGLADALRNAINVPGAGSITGDFLLRNSVSLDAYGIKADVAWTSGDPSVVSIKAAPNGGDSEAAVVKRPSCGSPVTVTLTATAITPQLPDRIVKNVIVTVEPQSSGQDATHDRVSSHDPTIVKADGMYYIFGSHLAWERSTDMQHWESFTNNLSTGYEQIFAKVWNAWPKQPSNPDVKGNMWAPEVIWNPAMGKWCMYMSINGGGTPYQKTVIVLLTASTIEGDWTYAGPVVYSGFQPSNAAQTDVYKVLGEGADLTRYSSLTDTGINAIDACVKFDANGDMWMSFGSWFGGIWMIRLDPKTGLRDYGTTYATTTNVSDAYYGHKLAGGHGNSGEGSYVVKKGDWWYLFLSYGGLTQTGGYQMREFRSKNITGPYLDPNGNSAVYSTEVKDDTHINRGLRIMSSYDQPGSENIKTSQGGNSVLVDDDGSVYNVFHTRFVRTTGALEEHQVRVQQMVVSPDGWLVSLPFEKSGEADLSGEYSMQAVAGTYDVVVHDPTRYYTGGGDSDAGIFRAQKIALHADGTLSGAATGSWRLNGSSTVELSIAHANDTRIHGKYGATLARQMDEKGNMELVFSGVGGDVFADSGPDVRASRGEAALWGSRVIRVSNAIVPCTNSPVPSPLPADHGPSGSEGRGSGSLAATGIDVVAMVVGSIIALVVGLIALYATKRSRLNP